MDLAVKLDIIQKAGSWFSYKENRLAQGRENVKEALKKDPALRQEIEALVRENLSKLNPAKKKEEQQAPVEIPIAAAAKISAPAAKAQIDIVVDDE